MGWVWCLGNQLEKKQGRDLAWPSSASPLVCSSENTRKNSEHSWTFEGNNPLWFPHLSTLLFLPLLFLFFFRDVLWCRIIVVFNFYANAMKNCHILFRQMRFFLTKEEECCLLRHSCQLDSLPPRHQLVACVKFWHCTCGHIHILLSSLQKTDNVITD